MRFDFFSCSCLSTENICTLAKRSVRAEVYVLLVVNIHSSLFSARWRRVSSGLFVPLTNYTPNDEHQTPACAVKSALCSQPSCSKPHYRKGKKKPILRRTGLFYTTHTRHNNDGREIDRKTIFKYQRGTRTTKMMAIASF